MSEKIILDASALLALINEEPGSDTVEKYFPNVVMSAVNLSEIATVLSRCGVPQQDIQNILSALISNVDAFDKEQAYIAAQISNHTKRHGLSFGDRACLSLGMLKQLPILTADKAWLKLDIDIDIISIR